MNLLMKHPFGLKSFERSDSPWAYWSTLSTRVLLGVMVEVFLIVVVIAKLVHLLMS